jgi:glycosidase
MCRYLLLFVFCSSFYAFADEFLHVPSPDWRDQIIYFAVTDRFNDGDPSNNDQKAGEYDQKSNEKYSGGDIKGLIKKIPYLKELGVTTVWITPVVANQWWDPWTNMSGYHGYWAENFMEVDKHKGSLSDYKDLSRQLHRNGMYLVKDIVCNHVGNFFRYKGTYEPNNLTKNFELNLNSKPDSKPSQYPFNMNDVRIPEHRKMNIYNWTPDVVDYRNSKQKLKYQMSGLDDLNTDNELVRKTLRDSFEYWIREVGVDAFRVDTVVYVDHDFWNFFNPAMESFAKKLGNDDFLIFAETWFNAEPLSEKGDKDTARYIGTKSKPEFNSVINFPLQNDTERVFGSKSPTSYLSFRLKSLFKNYKDPYRLVNFIDNHDMNRFLASYGKNSLVQAVAFIMTIPGIPSIYYGTEQGFTQSRASMFKEGFGSGDKDHFNTSSKYFKITKELISLRKNNEFFRRGKLDIIKDSPNGPGILAYKMQSEKGTGIVIFNTATVPILMDNLDTGLKTGLRLKSLYSYRSKKEDIYLGEGALISRIMAPESFIILKAEEDVLKEVLPVAPIDIKNMKKGMRINKNFNLRGGIREKLASCELKLVINSNLGEAISVDVDREGTWAVDVPVDNLIEGGHDLIVLGLNPKGDICAISKKHAFNIRRPFKKIVEYVDKKADDHGPYGRYIYPTHESFSRQADIEKVSLYRSGNNLKISIKMVSPISNLWNPKNGFDHVTFAIYFDVPWKKTGASYMPHQNYDLSGRNEMGLHGVFSRLGKLRS